MEGKEKKERKEQKERDRSKVLPGRSYSNREKIGAVPLETKFIFTMFTPLLSHQRRICTKRTCDIRKYRPNHASNQENDLREKATMKSTLNQQPTIKVENNQFKRRTENWIRKAQSKHKILQKFLHTSVREKCKTLKGCVCKS